MTSADAGSLARRIVYSVNYFDVLYIIIPTAIILVLFECAFYAFAFTKLRRSGLSIPSIVERVRNAGLRKYLNETRLTFSFWRLSYTHFRSVAVSAYLLYCGVHFTFEYGDYTCFARIGALVALVGIYSTILGYRHEDASNKIFKAINDPSLKEDLVAQNAHNPQRLAAWWCSAITVIGTLVWAYGDFFLQQIVSLPVKSSDVKPLVESAPDKKISSVLYTRNPNPATIFVPEPSPDFHGIQGVLENIERDVSRMAIDRPSEKLPAPEPRPTPEPSHPAPEAGHAAPGRTYSVTFVSGQTTLTAPARRTIAQVAASAASAASIVCNGYTDNSGDIAANLKMSVLRAGNVASELIHDGVPGARISIHGYGPQAGGRRVEIVVQ